MRIGYFVRNLGISGGVKVVLQHVCLLRELGHEAILVTRRIADDWVQVPAGSTTVNADLSDLPQCDLYVATVASDVRMLYGRRETKARLAHLCQSYEPEGYRARLRGESITEKYAASGPFAFLKRINNNRHFRKRIRDFEATYGLPTIKIAVSRHLAGIIEKEYGQKCFLVQNGVDRRVFHPSGERAFPSSGERDARIGRPRPVRLLTSGSINVGAKGIPDALAAVRLLKERGRPIEFTRVSPGSSSEKERESGIIDRFLTAVSEGEMADLYRKTDILIAPSLEGEGFGLPAIEAMSSGVPCVLTDISTYRNFGAGRDFACFVPLHRPDAIADAVETLIDNSALRDRCVASGLEVAQSFSLERTRDHLAAFVREIFFQQEETAR